ncbi:putative ATP11 protein [Trypanosoma cruzi]|nr:putative ATP11 protein [Trypanosoma cruzi]
MLRKSCALHGFYKLPGRKSLDEICKLSLLEATPTAQVAMIWNEHHKQFVQYWGRVISADAYDALRPRLQNCSYFVIPVFRTKGLFNVVTNWDKDLVGVAPLAEWQKKQDHAQIDMTIQFFTEFSRTKRIVLVRCEIKDKIFVRQDCVFITQMLLKYYTLPHLYETWVEVFNKRPHMFDYHMYLRHMKEEAQRDDIHIEDKKTQMKLDAYGPVIDTPPDAIAQQILGSVDTGVLQGGGTTTP